MAVETLRSWIVDSMFIESREKRGLIYWSNFDVRTLKLISKKRPFDTFDAAKNAIKNLHFSDSLKRNAFLSSLLLWHWTVAKQFLSVLFALFSH